MNLRALVRATATAGLLASLLAAAPAHAADEVTIDHVEVAEDGTVSVLVGVGAGAGAGSPDLDSVTVRVDGDPVDATAHGVEAGEVDRTTVLALDASNSMSGERIREAKLAAQTFLTSAPDDVLVGLVTFSGKVQEVMAPTTDRDALAAAIRNIDLTPGTRVYDAVVRAVDLTGAEGARTVLLLSDGKDQGGGATLTTAVRAARTHDVAVNVVALGRTGNAHTLVSRIAEASGGDVLESSSATSLSTVFAAEAEALARQVLVSFTQPEGEAREATLDIGLTVGDATYQDSAFLTFAQVGDGDLKVVDPATPLVTRAMMLAAAAAIGLGLLIMMGVILLGRRRQSASQQRLASYFGEVSPETLSGAKESALAFTSTFVRGDFETRLSQRLAAAGVSLTAAEWILLQAGITVGAALVGFLLGGVPLMVLGLLSGLLMPSLYLRRKYGKRLAAFSAQLPETLTLMSGSLSAGLSMTQSVDTVVREGEEPMASELRRALVEHRLGIDVEDGLDGVADRMGSQDFRWVVMAIRVQREVGGNLAELLGTVAETLREREFLRRQVRTLSAEGRLSAYILGGLPVFMFVYMLFANRDFVRPLYTEVLGWLMLIAAGFLLSLGSWFMSRLVKVEV